MDREEGRSGGELTSSEHHLDRKRRGAVTVLVRCTACDRDFRAAVGWQAYDEHVWLHLTAAGRRKGATMRCTQGLSLYAARRAALGVCTSEAPGPGWEMRIPLRVRRCTDHDEGTRGCQGELHRVS